MHLLPTPDEVVRILRETGGLREGHFLYRNGLHSNEYLQVPLAMRYYQHARTLGVGLSRLLRANPEIRAIIPELSIVAPASAGLPVAFGVCEALRARQVYWAESEADEPLHFRQYLEPHPGEPVVLVDDILRSGSKLGQMKTLLESGGAPKWWRWRWSSTSPRPRPTTSARCLFTTSPNLTRSITRTPTDANYAKKAYLSIPYGSEVPNFDYFAPAERDIRARKSSNNKNFRSLCMTCLTSVHFVTKLLLQLPLRDAGWSNSTGFSTARLKPLGYLRSRGNPGW